MTLTTRRLTLRAAKHSDLDQLFAIYSRPDAMRYWSTPPHVDKETTKGNLERLIASSKDRLVYFVFEYREQVIGLGGMHQDNEIGFLLHPDYWRQGFVSEAMQTIIPHLFSVTDHSALTAEADPLNTASIGLLTSLGFQETHRAKNTFFINGQWSDSVYFELPRPLEPHQT